MGHRERSRDAIKRTELEGREQCWWGVAQVSSMVFVSPPPEPPELTLNCLRPRPDVASACHDWTQSSSASTRVELAPCLCVEDSGAGLIRDPRAVADRNPGGPVRCCRTA